MMKTLLTLLFSVFTFQVLAQEQQQFVIISFATNGAYEEFNCERHKIYTLASNPVAIQQYDQSVKFDLAYKFLDYLYNNHLEDLNLIKGLTKHRWVGLYRGKSSDEALSKAKSNGALDDKSSHCRPKPGSWGKNNIILYDFQYSSSESLTQERKDFLRHYLENK